KAGGGERMGRRLDQEVRVEGLPLRGAAGRPSARAAGRVAAEPGRRNEPLELEGERFLLAAADGRGEAHVMQKAILAIESEQERADHRFALVVTETTDHAVCTAIVL